MNDDLKSQITRIESGQDAEMLARDYLDMAKADEILVKNSGTFSLLSGLIRFSWWIVDYSLFGCIIFIPRRFITEPSVSGLS